jgi:hypothetical protein
MSLLYSEFNGSASGQRKWEARIIVSAMSEGTAGYFSFFEAGLEVNQKMLKNCQK